MATKKQDETENVEVTAEDTTAEAQTETTETFDIPVDDVNPEDIDMEEAEIPDESEVPEESSTNEAGGLGSKPKKEKKEYSPDDLIALKSSRFASALTKASKKERAEMFKSEHIVTEYGDEEIDNDASRLKQEFYELMASRKSQKILNGVIVGYSYAGEPGKSTILVEVHYGMGLFTIHIPVYLLFDYDMENQEKYVSEDMNKLLENIVNKRIGSSIKFVVRSIVQKDRVAYADRLMAMAITGATKYTRKKKDEKPEIVNGILVKASVQQVMSQYIIVDAFGAEIKVPREELSWFHVGNAREEFKVGDDVVVKVSNISHIDVNKNGTKYRLITADGSVKAATKDPRPRLFAKYKEKGRYAAQVTYVEENGVFCRLYDGMDVLVAPPRFGDIPRRGQKRVIEIRIKDEERMRLLGIFTNN